MTTPRAIAPIAALALAAMLSAPAAAQGSSRTTDSGRDAPPIQDNSFLIEEAYNQERGVVQHISTFDVGDRGQWQYAFTQEWPVRGQRHQFSFTIPVQHAEEGGVSGTGLGDVLINYRLQLASGAASGVAFAPRLSLLLPTGDEGRGRGMGAVGLQGNLPLSVELSRQFVMHFNAGATVVPSARSPLDATATVYGFNVGQSTIWLVRRSFNVMLELAWTSEEGVVAEDAVERESSFVIAPGLRGAIDFASGLQIVPGIAFPIEMQSGSDDVRVLLYLSLEHAFSRR
ncbi:MAG TPA: hypothetical protein VJ596_07380 [Gemmatimonadaceae bacterium]|nr:hypothetical protein [Gemmatimonadaceae bacterium]